MKEKVNVTGVPETMKIRKQFLTETGLMYQIAKSVMDESYVDDIDYHGENVLVIIEGMKELMSVYCVIGKIPAVWNISNKIIVLEKCCCKMEESR